MIAHEPRDRLVSHSIVPELLLAELHRLNRVLLVDLHSQNSQTCANQDYFSFLINDKFHFIGEKLVVCGKVHLPVFMPLKQQEPVPAEVDNCNLVHVRDLALRLPGNLLFKNYDAKSDLLAFPLNS